MDDMSGAMNNDGGRFAKGTGRVPDPPDQRDHPIRAYLTPQPSPKRFSRLHQLGPVLDQGFTPRCVSHMGATIKTHHERRQHRRTYLFDTAKGYALCKERDGIPHEDGTFLRVMFDVLRHIGYGRTLRDFSVDAPKFKIKHYARLMTIAEMEEAIYRVGALGVGLDWDASWGTQSLILDTPARIRPAGGHAMVIAGYDRTKQVFEVRNSWGPFVHDRGNVLLSYREVERQLALPTWQAMDVWSVIDLHKGNAYL